MTMKEKPHYGSIAGASQQEQEERSPLTEASSSGGDKHSLRIPGFASGAAMGVLLILLVTLAGRSVVVLVRDDGTSATTANGGTASASMVPPRVKRPHSKLVPSELGSYQPPEPYGSYSKTQRYFDQILDHDDPNNKGTWSQRYYARKKYWKGPGHPIILMVGGEDGNDKGFFYPFVDDFMAHRFGAFCLTPEHRFYGKSLPIPKDEVTVQELIKYLTPAQAMRDMLNIVQHYRRELGCSMDRSSEQYCPLIVMGGSYPGFLAAMMRFLYPDVVDMAYSSSAPLLTFAKRSDPDKVFEAVTAAADRASPGCADAVRVALRDMDSILANAGDTGDDKFKTLAYQKLNVCPGSIPAYIDNGALLSRELVMVIAESFSVATMLGNYPPRETSWMSKLCKGFQNDDETLSSMDRVATVWNNLEDPEPEFAAGKKNCFNMSFQLSEGPRATMSSADWSGVGIGYDGQMWDFQCCMELMPELSMSEASMFPPRRWTYGFIKEHCLDRFGVVQDNPRALADKWKYDDLANQGASRILFTNGGNDMWMPGSYQRDLSDEMPVLNMPNGAHHSEVYYLHDDTEDIQEAQGEIVRILEGWLENVGTKKPN